jgi:hypothetical protein
MAADPGSTFAEHALAALTRARTQFEEDRWALGIEAASAEALRAALQQAISATAQATSCAPGDVARLVPTQRVEELLAELHTRQAAALLTARRYGSSFNSFLARSLHIEEPSAQAFLKALAARHYDDEFIRGPLSEYADSLASWKQLMDQCAGELASNASLRSAFRLRRLLRAALAAAAGFGVVVLLAAFAWWWLVAEAARKRVAAALDKPDPCADAAIAASDKKHATAAHLDSMARRAEQCAVQREREQYVARCAVLADHVEANQLTADDDAAAGQAAPLLRRVAGSTLGTDDLLVTDGALPCQDTPAGLRLWGATARSAAGSTELWGKADKVSPKMLGLLNQKPFELSAESQGRLSGRADAVSRRALVSGLPEELAAAHKLCELQLSLRAEPIGRGCKALQRLASRK